MPLFWTDSDNRGIPRRKKALCHLPKGMGGLGRRSIGTFNTVLLMHNAWRIQQNPLYRVFHPSRLLSRRSSLSWGAQGICQATTRLKSHCAWKVGDNGQAILAARDRWVNGSTPTLKADVPPQVALQLTLAALLAPSGHSWNAWDIRHLFTVSSACQILGMELPLVSNTQDALYWPYTKSGQFTTKSAYAIVSQQQ